MENEQEKQLAVQAQIAKTDKYTLNVLLHNYMPFIKKCVANVFFKQDLKADNLTDAMLAFTHSVMTYQSENGPFIKYAATVIRNRLLDNARKEAALQKRFRSLFTETITTQTYDRTEEERNLQFEIEAINGDFFQWGFSWASLLKKCPKQERSRRICFSIAETVQKSPELLADMLKNRQLPVNRLAETYPRKALEKYRQYIVALIILLQGDYPYIYSFVPQFFYEEANS